MVRKLLARLRGRDDVRQVGLLTSGAMIAQIGTLAATPILSRLFRPEDFGLLGLLMSINTVGGSVSALCYEQAILQPRSDRKARAVAALCYQLSFLGAALTTLITFSVAAAAPQAFGRHLGVLFFLCCFFGTLSTAHFNIFGYIHSRAGRYRPIAVSKINQSIMPTLAQLGFGVLRTASSGLIAGRVIGAVLTNIWLQRTLPEGSRIRELLRRPRRDVIAAARSYRDYIFHVPRQLLVRGASSAPSVLLLSAYGPVAAGLFFFAQRIVERPGMLLGDALFRVPLKQLSVRRADRKPLSRTALIYTAACAAPIFLGCAVLALIARPVIPVVFGAKWLPAADYLVVMAVWAGVRIAALPMSSIMVVLRMQKVSLVIDAIFATRVLVIPVMAAQHRSAIEAVAAFCALSVLYDVVVFICGLAYALRYDRQLGKDAPDAALRQG